MSVAYKTERSAGDYIYRFRLVALVQKDVHAIEITHVITDVFGRYLNTLQYNHVGDIEKGATSYLSDGEWKIYSEDAAKTSHASYSYVSAVRLADGSVYTAPINAILDFIKRQSPAITEADLLPKRKCLWSESCRP